MIGHTCIQSFNNYYSVIDSGVTIFPGSWNMTIKAQIDLVSNERIYSSNL